MIMVRIWTAEGGVDGDGRYLIDVTSRAQRADSGRQRILWAKMRKNRRIMIS